MKKIVYWILAMPMLLASCNNEEVELQNNESVTVSFTAELPTNVVSRADGDALNVNKVVCGVFEDGAEITNLREEINIVDGEAIVYAPRLIKGRNYDVVFWAMKSGSYNVADLTAISRNASGTAVESDFDAFTKSINVTVADSKSETITLVRPLAELNIGVTGEEWTALQTLNAVPGTTTIEMTGKESFNALAGEATGDDVTVSREMTVSGADLIVDGKSYKSIASCYVLPAGNASVKISVKDTNGKVIRENVVIDNVPFDGNYRTNIVGGLLTGTLNYTISIEGDFNDGDKTVPVE